MVKQNEAVPSHPDESFPTPAARAFAIPEVLEKIMQYASNRELWDHTRNYRLVCKQWRTWAFKGLKDSKFLPSLALQKHLPTPTTRKSTKKVSWMSKFEENFNTPVKLPIGLIINEKLTKKEIEFIHKYSSMIVHLEVNMYTRNSKKGTEGHLDLILALQLINLQSISVRWARGGEKTKMQLEQFVSHVVGSSRKLQTVKVTYPDHACTGYLPKCPPSVTHIWITGNLQNVIDVMPTRSSHLQALHINLLESEGLHGARFTNILERSSSTLETLKVANYFGNEFRGELQIPTLKCLKTFEVNVPFSLESDSNLPSIQKLLYLLGDDPTFEWPAAETRRLTHVTLKWPDVEPHQQRDIQIRKLEKIYEENCIRKIENEGITLSGKVKGLLLNNLPYRVALAVMPKVYASMLNISKLTLFVSRSIWISRPSTRDSSDLLMMLTGLRPQDVPMDETVWPELLRDKRNAITSLKKLEHLQLAACKRSSCFVGKFLFVAAFLQMTKLRTIEIKGNITVPQDLMNEWTRMARPNYYSITRTTGVKIDIRSDLIN